MIRIPAKNSFFILLFLIIFTGCGVKSNPVPYPAVLQKKPAVKNMEISMAEDAVVLKWILQDKDGLISFMIIERSEVGTPGNECKDCPRTYERIGQIAVKGAIAAPKEEIELNFIDKKVVKGKIYGYRLKICEENGNCLEASQGEINFK